MGGAILLSHPLECYRRRATPLSTRFHNATSKYGMVLRWHGAGRGGILTV
jgi:hypothetical protein